VGQAVARRRGAECDCREVVDHVRAASGGNASTDSGQGTAALVDHAVGGQGRQSARRTGTGVRR